MYQDSVSNQEAAEAVTLLGWMSEGVGLTSVSASDPCPRLDRHESTRTESGNVDSCKHIFLHNFDDDVFTVNRSWLPISEEGRGDRSLWCPDSFFLRLCDIVFLSTGR